MWTSLSWKCCIADIDCLGSSGGVCKGLVGDSGHVVGIKGVKEGEISLKAATHLFVTLE